MAWKLRKPKRRRLISDEREVVNKYIYSFVKDTLIVFLGALAAAASFLTIATLFFNFSENKRFQEMGLLGYYSIVIQILLVAVLISVVLMFKNLWRDSRNLRFTGDLDVDGNDDKLSNELVETVRKLHQSGEHMEVVRLCDVLSRPLWLSGRNDQRIAIGSFYEDSAANAHMFKEQALALIDDVGWTNAFVGNLEVAKRNINTGIQIAATNNLLEIATKGYRHLGTIALRFEKNHIDAKTWLEKAEESATGITDEHKRDTMIAGIKYNQAEISLEMLNWEEAEQNVDEALNTFIRLNDRERAIKAKSLKARIYMSKAETGQARDLFREALQEARQLTRRDEIGKCLLGLGELYLMENNKELSINMLSEAVEIFEKIHSAKELTRAKELQSIALSEDQAYVP